MSRTTESKTTGHAPSARILARLREDALDLALLATAVDASSWSFVAERGHTRLYKLSGTDLPSSISTVDTFGRGGGDPSEFHLVRAVATLDADVTELLDFLDAPSSTSYHAVMKKLFGKLFESGVTLDKLTCSTPPPRALDVEGGEWRTFSEDDAYCAHWLTLRVIGALGGVDNHHDFTLMSYQDVFTRGETLERQGRAFSRAKLVGGPLRIGVHTMSSMNFKDIPELPRSSRTDRLHFRNSGIVVEETANPAAVRVSLFLSLMPTKTVLKSVAPSPRLRAAQSSASSVSKKYKKWLQALAFGLEHLVLAAKPEVVLHRLGKMAWVESDHCFLCHKAFRALRRCHHCRFCGEAVCGHCSGFLDMSAFDVSYSQRHSGSSEDVVAGYGLGGGEEYMETRGCLTCLAELQMNLSPTAHRSPPAE